MNSLPFLYVPEKHHEFPLWRCHLLPYPTSHTSKGITALLLEMTGHWGSLQTLLSSPCLPLLFSLICFPAIHCPYTLKVPFLCLTLLFKFVLFCPSGIKAFKPCRFFGIFPSFYEALLCHVKILISNKFVCLFSCWSVCCQFISQTQPEKLYKRISLPSCNSLKNRIMKQIQHCCPSRPRHVCDSSWLSWVTCSPLKQTTPSRIGLGLWVGPHCDCVGLEMGIAVERRESGCWKCKQRMSTQLRNGTNEENSSPVGPVRPSFMVGLPVEAWRVT